MSTEIYLPAAPESVIHPHDVTEKTRRVAVPRNKSKYIGPEATADMELSPWCVSASKRVFDLACVVPALILLSPFLALIALAIRITSPGPIVFCQKRVGRNRSLFTIYKFRTMMENSETGSELTATGDPRITPIGHLLRRSKLDELLQLFNVLRGEMSLVGPRPKLPQLEPASMVCRPGITGAATLLFRREQQVLRQIPEEEVGLFYAQYIAPAKVRLDTAYMKSSTFFSDIGIICKTVFDGGRYLTMEELVKEDFSHDMIEGLVAMNIN